MGWLSLCNAVYVNPDRSGLYPVWFLSIICSAVEQVSDLWCLARWVSVCLTACLVFFRGKVPLKDLENMFPGMSGDFTSENFSATWYLIENHSSTGLVYLPSVHLLICQNRFVCNVVLMFVAVVVLSNCV